MGEIWKKLEQGEGNAQKEKGQWSVGEKDKRNYWLRNYDHRKEKLEIEGGRACGECIREDEKVLCAFIALK